MMQTEAFDRYAKIGRGIPFLCLIKRRNSASAIWGDGTLWDYNLFRREVAHVDMIRDLHTIWEKVPTTRRKAELHTGSVIGGIYSVPPDIAVAAFHIVRDYFTKGLDAMILPDIEESW